MLLIVEGLYLCYNEELLLKVYYKIDTTKTLNSEDGVGSASSSAAIYSYLQL